MGVRVREAQGSRAYPAASGRRRRVLTNRVLQSMVMSERRPISLEFMQKSNRWIVSFCNNFHPTFEHSVSIVPARDRNCCTQGLGPLNIVWRRFDKLTREVKDHRQRLSTFRCRARK
jgi:hypothetical protein